MTSFWTDHGVQKLVSVREKYQPDYSLHKIGSNNTPTLTSNDCHGYQSQATPPIALFRYQNEIQRQYAQYLPSLVELHWWICIALMK